MSDADPPRDILPNYEVLDLLGRGGMGVVYKARQISLDRIVAIKLLPHDIISDDMDFTARFKLEARTMAKLSHTRIVPVYEFGETADGQLFFVMEFIDGTDLAKVIEQQGALPVEEALRIFSAAAEALEYAHREGVIHRDIKPANLLINEDGEVKVADFGLAKIIGPAQESGLTRTNVAMGTQEFAAPEQLTPGATVDHRADIYSLGVMLYQMLTGTVPRVMFKLPSLCRPELGTRFDALICKALETNPADRFQTVDEFQRALAADHVVTRSTRRSLPALRWASVAAVVMGIAIFALSKKPPTSITTRELSQSTATRPLPHNEWIKLLDSPEAVARSGITNLEWKDGWLTVPPRHLYLTRLAGGNKLMRDMAFRVTLRPPENGWCIAAVLHAGADQYYFLDVFKDHLTLRRETSSKPFDTELRNVPLDLRQSKDGAFQLEVSIQGNLITAIADGAKVMEVSDEGASGAGDIALVAPSQGKGTGKIKDLAFRVLD